MIKGGWMSRASSIIVPGGKMDFTMQLIFTPMIELLVNQSRRA
jgi:phosphoribulokinase